MKKKELLHQAEILLQEMEKNNYTEANTQYSSEWHHCVNLWNDISKKLDMLKESDQKCAVTELFQLTEQYESPEKADPALIFHMALCIQSNMPEYTNHAIERIYRASNISDDTKHFLYWQITMQAFPKSKFILDGQSNILLRKIYHSLFMKLAEIYRPAGKCRNRTIIPAKDRDTDLVLVTIGQLGKISHGPTKTVLDRCDILANKYHKKVLLVETAEFGTQTGAIPLLKYVIGNHRYKSVIASMIEYNNISIPFIQMNTEWTMKEKCDVLTDIVREKKPLFILNVGGDSLATDICSYIVPTYTISTIPSGLATTEGTFQMTGHVPSKNELEFLRGFGKDASHVIEGIFTSTVLTPEHHYTREELELPEDKFIIIMVGFRLSDEVTREFMEMLLSCTGNKAFYIFLGNMNTYDQFAETISGFQENCKFLGFINDVVSAAQLADLYINPKRTGGGTSSVEAMSVGVPVLSYTGGDVAINAGNDFCVDTDDEFCRTLQRYLTDSAFHSAQSSKAKNRADILLDSSGNFSSVLEEFYRRAGIGEEYWYSKENLQAETTSFLFREQMRCYFDYELKLDAPISGEMRKKYFHREAETAPVFSIMMAVYNDVSLLNSAINSLLRQEFKSWELLIWDNSSETSNAWNMIQNATELDGRIHAFRSDRNLGWAKAASLLLKKAAGQYATFLSADDCLNFGALAKLHRVIEKEDPDVIFVGNGYIRYSKENDGSEQVELLGVQKPAYHVYDKADRSKAIVDIMQSVYYNSMFHYCKTEFLKKYQIDFFRPYYADCASMTHAMAKAGKIVVLDELIYYLTQNTSQTSGYYIWDSYRNMYANQWNSVKEVFDRECCYDHNLIFHAASRIWSNLTANIGTLCTGKCRNRYMNAMEVSVRDLIGQLEDSLSSREVLEMAFIMGKQGIDDLLEHISHIKPIYAAADGNEALAGSWLSSFLKIAVENHRLSPFEKLKYIIDFILEENNHLCLGAGYMIELASQCSDADLAEENQRIQCVIAKYDQSMGRLNDAWLAKVLA